MKKFLVGGLAVAALAMPSAAAAQTPLPAPVVTTEGSISNNNAGTARTPTPVRFQFRAVNSAESQTTVSRIVLDMPTGVRLDGTRLAVCASAVLQRRGPSACPRASRLGSGVAYASLVNPAAPAPDCAGTRGAAQGCITFDTTFFVGGKRLLSVWLVAPALNIQRALQGRITRSGRRLTLDIPRDLQSPTAGVFSALQQLSGSWFRTRRAGGRRYSFVSTTACGSGNRWAFRTTFFYVPNPTPPPVTRQLAESRQTCRR